MHNRQPPDASRSQELEPLDFALTDISDARHSLEELPPGVSEVQAQQPGFWEQRRRRPLPTDRALTGTAMDWVVRLPATLRPHQLCEAYPRVANELAAKWSDDIACTAYFESLLTSRRPLRQGFPAPVAEEIVRLREYRRVAGGRLA
jgi:hypothetical protein